MDANWCLFCEKHIRGRSAAYCSKACLGKDALRSAVGSSPAAKEHLPLKRKTLSSIKVSYPPCILSFYAPPVANHEASATKTTTAAYTPDPTIKMHRRPHMAPT
ncbi:hypothetical protein EC968_008613 [Mortierella alpina]|nr:hypothetical protein EC968_008613 [Mortierella alpina]